MTSTKKKKSNQAAERICFLIPDECPYHAKFMTRAIYGGLAKHEASCRLPDDLVVYRGTYKGERVISFATAVPQEKEKLVLYLESVLPRSVRIVFLDPALIEDARKLKVNYDSENNNLTELECTDDNTGSPYTLAAPQIGECTGCETKGLFLRTTCSDHHLCSLCDPGPTHASKCLQCDLG